MKIKGKQRSSSRRRSTLASSGTSNLTFSNVSVLILTIYFLYILEETITSKDIIILIPSNIKYHLLFLLIIITFSIFSGQLTNIFTQCKPHIIPKRLILIRHGQSEGNVNSRIYETTPDSQIHLTPKGWDQAIAIGKVLETIVDPKESTRFYVSPYVRARETFVGISSSMPRTRRGRSKWCEDPRLREQDHGNFQQHDKIQEEIKSRGLFSKFFYRFQNGGESAADVYDRVSLFLESLFRNWKRRKGHLNNHNTIVVAHGLTIQVFFMRFFKYSVDDFCRYENPNNCEAAVLEREYDWDQKRYCLMLKYIVGPDGIKHKKRRIKLPSQVTPRKIHSSKDHALAARNKE